MLLTKVLHRIFVPFCVNFRPSVPPKSRFSLERVVDFEVFRTFLPTTLLNPFRSQFWTLWGSFWQLWGPFGRLLTPLGASCGLFWRPLPLSFLKNLSWERFWTPKVLQEPPRSTKIDQNRPPLPPIGALKLTKINENQRKFTKIYENQRKSTKIVDNRRKSIKINQNLPKSTNRNLPKSMQID